MRTAGAGGYFPRASRTLQSSQIKIKPCGDHEPSTRISGPINPHRPRCSHPDLQQSLGLSCASLYIYPPTPLFFSTPLPISISASYSFVEAEAMLAKTSSSALSLLLPSLGAPHHFPAGFSGFYAPRSSVLRFPRTMARDGSIVAAAAAGADSQAVAGIIFEPFEELKHEHFLVPLLPDQSIARQKYSVECEAAINEQIKWVCIFLFTFLCGFVDFPPPLCFSINLVSNRCFLLSFSFE